MLKKFLLVIFSGLWCVTLVLAQRSANAQQNEPAVYKNNSCVSCHSQLAEPVRVSNKYLEWQFSKHREKGVSCDKCHGGNSTAADKQKAHTGVQKASVRESRLYAFNQPETCNTCHKSIVNSFVQSDHYKKLRAVGLGPTCNTCHAHMATKVLYSASEASDLCAQCHNAINFLPPRPEIPAQAEDVILAFQRANNVINWAKLLIAEGRRHGLNFDADETQLRQSEALLSDAKIAWHSFELRDVRKRADDAYFAASRIKDSVRKRIAQ
ncbi:MAG: hypothetical protein IPL01_17665 [Acidobacteria bacterium]|nr:hypothetical protein [Acidobacteriota bacterium]